MFGLYNGIFQIKYLSEIKNDEAAGAEKAVVEEVVDELPEESPEVESDEDIKADASLVKAIDTYRKIKEIDKELTEKEQENAELLVTSTTAANGKKQDEAVTNMRKKGAKTARVSGWCAFSEWALRSVDAGFPISDHSDFSGTMKFVEECNPKQVYTVHGSTKELAKQIEKQLGINAQPLPKYGQASIEKYN